MEKEIYIEMTMEEIMEIFKDYFGEKISDIDILKNGKEVLAVLYGAVVFHAELSSPHEGWTQFCYLLALNDSRMFPGFNIDHLRVEMNPRVIREDCKRIDEICKLRLPDKYLNAYYKSLKKNTLFDKLKNIFN